MARAEDLQTASFMALCLGDFSSNLWIPAKFVSKYRQVARQAWVMVENDEIRCWKVKIEDMNGDLFMKDGWSEFVKDNHISGLDCLTLRLLDDSTFKVSILTADGCPRHPAFPTSGGGDEISNRKPFFFKALSNMDITKLLRVPPFFFENYGLTPPKIAKLRLHSGETWNVMVERLTAEGPFCFTKGWRSFAEDVGLQLNEFLVLSLVREREFDVAIYDTGMCEREKKIPAAGVEAAGNGTNVTRNRHKYSSSNPLYVEKCLQPSSKSRMSLRMKFVKAAGLWGRKSVMLKHVENRICISVEMDHMEKLSRIDLTKGWSDFREANELEYGKIYSYRFDPVKDVILVSEVKERNYPASSSCVPYVLNL